MSLLDVFFFFMEKTGSTRFFSVRGRVIEQIILVCVLNVRPKILWLELTREIRHCSLTNNCGRQMNVSLDPKLSMS